LRVPVSQQPVRVHIAPRVRQLVMQTGAAPRLGLLLHAAIQAFISPLQSMGCAIADCAKARKPAVATIETSVLKILILACLNARPRRFAA
jgi:hypothetical protein